MTIKSESCNEFSEKRIAEVMEISALDDAVHSAPTKTEMYGKWVRVLIGIGTDHTAYVSMTEEAYTVLMERKHQRDAEDAYDIETIKQRVNCPSVKVNIEDL